MTLRDFLEFETRAYEICLIYANHSTVAISWTFEESFSAIPEKYLNWTVKDDKWVEHATIKEGGLPQLTQFHRITIEKSKKKNE